MSGSVGSGSKTLAVARRLTEGRLLKLRQTVNDAKAQVVSELDLTYLGGEILPDL
jgi:hypothetical protein